MSKNLHADFRDTFIFVVNSRWKKIEEEKNALDAMKQSLEKEGGKINRVLLVWLFSYSLKREQICSLPCSRFYCRDAWRSSPSNDYQLWGIDWLYESFKLT